MAPLPVWGVAVQKIVSGALQGAARGRDRVPARDVDPDHAGAPRRALARCC